MSMSTLSLKSILITKAFLIEKPKEVVSVKNVETKTGYNFFFFFGRVGCLLFFLFVGSYPTKLC